MSAPTVEVVIATYNRHRRLERTLASLDRQTERGFRVTVVDDGSRPPVATTLSSEFAGQNRVRILSTEGNRGPAAARNIAVRESSAELVAFIDDDVDADPTWLSVLLSRWKTAGEHAVIIGPLLAPADWKPTPWNRWEADRVAREYRRMERGEYQPTWRQFFTGNAMLARSDFIAAGGFNERFTRAEDIELGLRMHRRGCRFVFEPNAKGWHYAYRTAEAWLANAESYARFDAEMDRLYPELQWLALVREELSSRRRSSRLMRGVAVGCLGRRHAVTASVAVARLLNRRPVTRLSVQAASLAYDIRCRSAIQGLEAAGLRPNVVFDAPSTHDT